MLSIKAAVLRGAFGRNCHSRTELSDTPVDKELMYMCLCSFNACSIMFVHAMCSFNIPNAGIIESNSVNLYVRTVERCHNDQTRLRSECNVSELFRRLRFAMLLSGVMSETGDRGACSSKPLVTSFTRLPTTVELATVSTGSLV